MGFHRTQQAARLTQPQGRRRGGLLQRVQEGIVLTPLLRGKALQALLKGRSWGHRDPFLTMEPDYELLPWVGIPKALS